MNRQIKGADVNVNGGNRRAALVAAAFLLVLLLSGACTRGTPTPVTTRIPRPTVPLRVTVRAIPPKGTSPLTSPVPQVTPRMHIPFVGQHSRNLSPAPPSPSPTTGRPTLYASPTPPPSPPPVTSPSPPAQQVHIPILFSNPPPITGEPLPASGRYLSIVIDASEAAGSPFAGEAASRLDAVRQVLATVLPTNAADARTNVVVLGGPDATCTENVHPLGDFQQAKVIAWPDLLAGIRAQGSLPLAEGLLQAADAFPAGARRPIILISAGGRTCGEDACQIARVLERAETDASVHVIDVGAEGPEEAALRCVAQASGGAYYKVRSRQGLENALRDALTHALGGQIRVEVAGAKARPFFPAVVVGKAAEVVRTFDAWTDADLAPGSYTVSVGTPFPLAFENVIVRPGERTRLHVQLGELLITLGDPSGAPLSAEVVVSRPDYGPFFSRVGSRVDIPLPAGRYTATIRMDTAMQPLAYARDLPVIVGETTERRLTLPVGRLTVNLMRGGGSATAFVEIAPADTPDLISMAGWANGTIEAVLPGGEYRVQVRRYAGSKVFLQVDDVPLAAGEQRSLDLNLDDGTLRVADTATDGTHLSGRVRVFVRATKQRITEGIVGATLTVPAGEYDVLVETDGGEELWAWNVSVRARENTDVVLERPQARLWARTVDPAGRNLPARGTLLTVEGVKVQEGRLPARWIVPPGEYRLQVSGYDVTNAVTESDVLGLGPGDLYTLTQPIDVAALIVSPANADRVLVSVYAAGDRNTLLGETTGGLPFLRLPPGTYDIRVRDADAPTRESWLEGIFLAKGKTRQVHITLP